DDDLRLPDHIPFTEIAPAKKLNAHRAEVIRADDVDKRVISLSRRLRRPPLDAEETRSQAAGQPQPRHRTHRLYVRQRRDVVANLLKKTRSLAPFAVLRAGESNRHRQQIVGIEPQIDLIQTDKALDHQTGPNQERQR